MLKLSLIQLDHNSLHTSLAAQQQQQRAPDLRVPATVGLKFEGSTCINQAYNNFKSYLRRGLFARQPSCSREYCRCWPEA